MPQIKRILLFISLLSVQTVMASHILGGQIRYRHVQGQRYQFTAEIFRDCSGCKLNGNGGGFSKDNCDDISRLFITDPITGSSVTTRGSISLQRISIEDISPICASAFNSCSNGSGISGIEKHTFTGEFDFASISSSERCEFEIHLQISSRGNELTNGMAAEKFHINTRLNLCTGQTNNSAVFQTNPVFQLQKDASYRLSHYATDPDGDSLVYRLVRPYTDFGVKGNYISGFGANYPLSCHCPFGGNCQPYPELEIPAGFFLSVADGSMVFTPVKASEHTVVCLEIQEFRKIGSSYIQVGTIRRDIQLSVLQGTQNTPPVIQNKSSYSACVGDEFCLPFDLKDEAYESGSETKYDTLDLSIRFSGSGGTLKRETASTPPYATYTFCFTPSTADSFESESVLAEVKDRFCPRPLLTQKSFEIHILPTPKVDIRVQELPCNLYKLSFESNMPMVQTRWQIFNSSNQLIFEKDHQTDSFILQKRGTYRIRLTANNGACSASFERTIEVQSDLASVVEILGNRQVCSGDTVLLTTKVTDGYKILHSRWYTGSHESSREASLQLNSTQNTQIQLIAAIEKDGIQCHSSDTHFVNVLTPELPHFIWENQICGGSGEYDLSGITVPAGGQWLHEPASWLSGTILRVDTTPHADMNARLIYRIMDQNNCIATHAHSYKVLAPAPLQLRDLSICGGSDISMTLNPLLDGSGKQVNDLSWDLSNVQSYTNTVGGLTVIRLFEMPAGTYRIPAWYTDQRGCSSRDTALIRLQPTLIIEHKSVIPDICLDSGPVDLFALTGIEPKGGIFTSDHPDDVIQNGWLTQSSCGKRVLSYTYDQFNCFARTAFEIEARCKPEMSIASSHKKICDAQTLVQLQAHPSGGRWNSSQVTEDGWMSIQRVNKPEIRQMLYTVNLGTCAYSELLSLEIHPSPVIGLSGVKSSYCEGEIIEGNINGQGVREIKLISNSGLFDTSFFMPPGIHEYQWEWNKYLDQTSTSVKEIQITPVHDLLCPDLSIFLPIVIYPSPLVKHPDKISGCHPMEADLNAQLLNYPPSEAIFTWDFNDGELITSERSRIQHTYLLPGVYHPSLNVALSNGCMKRFNYPDLVKVYETPKAQFRSEPDYYVSNAKPEFFFINESSGSSLLQFHWDFGTTNTSGNHSVKNPYFKYPSDTSEYEVILTVTGDGGCTDVASKKVLVGPDIKLFIPNAFSPDLRGPGINNRFGLQGQNIASINIEVFDRWGMKVFHGQNISDVWDGTHQNRPCLPGVYSYSIRALTITGNEYQYSGTLHLLR